MARDFNGTSDFLSLGNPAALQLTGAMTVACWAKHDVGGVSGRMAAKQGAAGDRGYSLATEATNLPSFQISDAANVVVGVNALTALVPGALAHWGGTYEPSTALRLYRNGVLDNSNTTSIPAAQRNSTLNVEIGRRPDATGHWDGLLAEVAIWNRALSAAEMATVFASRPSAVPSGLVSFVPIDGLNSPERSFVGPFATVTGTVFAAHPVAFDEDAFQADAFQEDAFQMPVAGAASVIPVLLHAYRQRRVA